MVLSLILIFILLITSCSTENISNEEKTMTISEKSENIIFELDEGYRLNYASNPRIMSYEDSILGLGYEFNSPELMNNPSESGYIAFSEDGLEFTGERRFTPGESAGSGILLEDGTYRRFYFSPEECAFVGEYSEDGTNFEEEDWIAFDLNQYDDCWAGVYTYFTNEENQIVILYNNNFDSESGEQEIHIRKIHSEDNGETFEFDGTVINEYDEKNRFVSFADPNAIILDDNRILLITMNQNPDEPKAPLGRTGDIYVHISDDGAESFENLGILFNWEDFEEYEVRSLNDPKIVQFDDGTYRIYVAGLIPLEGGESSEENDYKYVMLSAKWDGIIQEYN